MKKNKPERVDYQQPSPGEGLIWWISVCLGSLAFTGLIWLIVLILQWISERM